jgi:hypothetical protein
VGVTQDHQEAAKWYRLAAEQGDAFSQYNLGLLYLNGQGITQDYIRAYMWFDLVANKGHNNAREDRAWIATEMTVSQIINAQEMARVCERKSFKSCI